MGPNGMDTGNAYSSFIWDSKEAARHPSAEMDTTWPQRERNGCCMNETLTHSAEWRKPYIKTYCLQDYRTFCCSKNILRRVHTTLKMFYLLWAEAGRPTRKRHALVSGGISWFCPGRGWGCTDVCLHHSSQAPTGYKMCHGSEWFRA